MIKFIYLFALLFLTGCVTKETYQIETLVKESYNSLILKDVDSAKDFLRKAQEIQPKCPDVLCLNAYILLLYDKEIEKAQTILKDVFEIDDKFGRAYYLQGVIDNSKGKSPCPNYKKAIEYGFEVSPEAMFFYDCN